MADRPYSLGRPLKPPVTAWMMMDPQGRLNVDPHSTESAAWYSVADPGRQRQEMRRAGWRAVKVRIEVVGVARNG